MTGASSRIGFTCPTHLCGEICLYSISQALEEEAKYELAVDPCALG